MGRKTLTHDDVLTIRRLLDEGKSQREIAEHFSINQSLISMIKCGKRRSRVDSKIISIPVGESFDLGGLTARIVPRFQDYAVTMTGRVFNRKTGGWVECNLTIFNGYYRVWLDNNGERGNCGVNRLVLEAFVGPCPEGMQACHFPDRNPLNNNLENLRWDTVAGNAEDRRRHGTLLMGEKVATSKLTEEQVREILAAPKSISSVKLAKKYPVLPRQIRRIRQGVRWAHVA